ncbi:hypothetical protein ETQ85_18880 [Zoogloea oleivorans]|uniref:Uncharacterized protein n=1 Tax=Zoogloea oleivorans TaxID=1552750 RepID=A0A6C2CKL6_9RHOO|nr:hypothetical protein [Zoogloea oleivorans]TYC54428.1 hypothetical protein ETQ85_18880 [Zoogloea oleivorans]
MVSGVADAGISTAAPLESGGGETWLGISPTVYLLFLLLADVLAPWPLLPRIMVLTVLVVAVMTWLVAPRLTRLLKPWLYPSSSLR